MINEPTDHQKTTEATPLIWKGYEEALRGLSCRDMGGKLMEPEIALVRFKDGWRQFARHNGIDGISTTAWPIDPKLAIDELASP
jgi:hypothetical protein